jgi:hypothetical protein
MHIAGPKLVKMDLSYTKAPMVVCMHSKKTNRGAFFAPKSQGAFFTKLRKAHEAVCGTPRRAQLRANTTAAGHGSSSGVPSGFARTDSTGAGSAGNSAGGAAGGGLSGGGAVKAGAGSKGSPPGRSAALPASHANEPPQLHISISVKVPCHVPHIVSHRVTLSDTQSATHSVHLHIRYSIHFTLYLLHPISVTPHIRYNLYPLRFISVTPHIRCAISVTTHISAGLARVRNNRPAIRVHGSRVHCNR